MGERFGLIVRVEEQLAEVREKLTKKYKLKLIEDSAGIFTIHSTTASKVVHLDDESLVWLICGRAETRP